MEDILASLKATGLTEERAPSLLLHSCCGPCSTAVIASLSAFFKITVFYYNPNIDEKNEYEKRAREQERLIRSMPTQNPVLFLEGTYCPEDFLSQVQSYANEREGGIRCTICYTLRLEHTAKQAHEDAYDFFTTTLSVSPMKDAERINSIGNALSQKYEVTWLWSDFKKKDGYKKSIELSKEYDLYRQNYCGCSFSKRDINI